MSDIYQKLFVSANLNFTALIFERIWAAYWPDVHSQYDARPSRATFIMLPLILLAFVCNVPFVRVMRENQLCLVSSILNKTVIQQVLEGFILTTVPLTVQLLIFGTIFVSNALIFRDMRNPRGGFGRNEMNVEIALRFMTTLILLDVISIALIFLALGNSEVESEFNTKIRLLLSLATVSYY